RIVNGLRDARVLISATGLRGHILKIRPPLVFSTQNLDHFVDRLQGVLKAL
ncbi:MAG: aspartate aminotransferase family protein, partial [Tabrizicola sp.]|nr:aspartate aminotransferase family protein [Tabrizicola sp.]